MTIDNASDVSFETGYDKQTVKEYVGEIRDRGLLHRLKDSNRNKAFRKIVLDYRFHEKSLICDSDDIAIIYDCQTQTVSHWFIKDHSRRLHDDENNAVCFLKQWGPADRRKYREECERALEHLDHITSLIAHLLG